MMSNSALVEHLQELRRQQAHNFDPVGFAFIEALARRAQHSRPRVQALIATRALNALADYERRRQHRTPEPEPISTQRSPGVSHSGLSELIQALTPDDMGADPNTRGLAFAEELKRLEQSVIHTLTCPPGQRGEASPSPKLPPPQPLRASRRYEANQASDQATRLVNRAERNAPIDPGPLNPQMLAIRALTTMRDLSPPYLARFVSYLDTLFWLDQVGGKEDPGKRKNPNKP